MSNLTDDECAVLIIAAEGESIAAIGRWEKPIGALVERGLMRRGDKFNNFITSAGRASIEEEMRGRDQALVGTLQTQKKIQAGLLPPVEKTTCAHTSLEIRAGGMQVVCHHCGSAWVKQLQDGR